MESNPLIALVGLLPICIYHRTKPALVLRNTWMANGFALTADLALNHTDHGTGASPNGHRGEHKCVGWCNCYWRR